MARQSAFLLLAFFAGAALVFFFYHGEGGQGTDSLLEGDGARARIPVEAPEPEPTEYDLPAGEAAEPSTAPSLVRVAIVIDDMGASVAKVRALLDVDAPITFAVIPHLRWSKEVAEAAHLGGREVILHLPMEPQDLANHDPGKGALLTTMSDGEVRAAFREGLDAVPHISGVNNHMGSRFTEDEALMTVALAELKGRGIYFLDSKTTGRSAAGRVAKKLGVPMVGRNIFLDNNRDEAEIKARLMDTVAIARRRGAAIAIGHPYPETIAVLSEMVPALRAEGVEVVTLSALVDIKE